MACWKRHGTASFLLLAFGLMEMTDGFSFFSVPSSTSFQSSLGWHDPKSSSLISYTLDEMKLCAKNNNDDEDKQYDVSEFSGGPKNKNDSKIPTGLESFMDKQVGKQMTEVVNITNQPKQGVLSKQIEAVKSTLDQWNSQQTSAILDANYQQKRRVDLENSKKETIVAKPTFGWIKPKQYSDMIDKEVSKTETTADMKKSAPSKYTEAVKPTFDWIRPKQYSDMINRDAEQMKALPDTSSSAPKYTGTVKTTLDIWNSQQTSAIIDSNYQQKRKHDLEKAEKETIVAKPTFGWIKPKQYSDMIDEDVTNLVPSKMTSSSKYTEVVKPTLDIWNSQQKSAIIDANYQQKRQADLEKVEKETIVAKPTFGWIKPKQYSDMVDEDINVKMESTAAVKPDWVIPEQRTLVEKGVANESEIQYGGAIKKETNKSKVTSVVKPAFEWMDP